MIHATPGATIDAPFRLPPSRVAELLRQYFRIAFLMARPQDLPGGRVQMQIGVALAFATYLIAMAGPYGIGRSLLHVLLDLGCTALALHVALALVGHPGRFEQAFGGLCGASAFVNAAAVPIYHSRPPLVDGAFAPAPAFAEFVLLVWSLSLLGHVLRHTFELRLGTSIGIAFVYVVVLTAVMEALLPGPPTREGEMPDEPLSRWAEPPFARLSPAPSAWPGVPVPAAIAAEAGAARRAGGAESAGWYYS